MPGEFAAGAAARIAAPEALTSFWVPQTISALCDLVVNLLDLERHAAILRVLQVAFEEEVPFGLQFVAFTFTFNQCLLHCLQPHNHYEAFSTRFARFQREFSSNYVRSTVRPAAHLDAFGDGRLPAAPMEAVLCKQAIQPEQRSWCKQYS